MAIQDSYPVVGIVVDGVKALQSAGETGFKLDLVGMYGQGKTNNARKQDLIYAISFLNHGAHEQQCAQIGGCGTEQ
ncbi:MAG TPA: hypothetical protein VN371_04175 [Chlorobaculum sp.]|nr:hypothetical protein [Chlorobaculum sp.]